MRKISVFFVMSFFLMQGSCLAQVFVEPIVGYQINLNNNNGFKQINSAVQFSFKKSSHYEFILQLQRGWALSTTSTDAAFTLNPGLPVEAAAQKAIKPSSLSFSLAHRIVVFSKAANAFSVILATGVTHQKIAVNYQYDKSNYTILNPDQTQKRTNIFLSGGIEYMRLLKSGRLFFQAIAATAPLGKDIKYPSSFRYMAPLSFNAGYSIPISKEKIKKNRHEKR